ncbi:hypothetical protein [Vibrio gangliei]|uniref:hypothetical protein n=1 Tax=Vibrio gangliei TaxID=2077090 RepID=UPI000D01A694|nr:hypothetical protein [Vibrio gangliei]
MKKFLTFLMATLIPSHSFAGSQTGVITNLTVRASDGLIYFYMNGETKNKPECATYNYWMIRDENSNTGKQQYSLLLSAFASQTKVTVEGMNSCIRWKDGEDINVIRAYK